LNIHNEKDVEANGASCISEFERNILQEQLDVPEARSSYPALYRYASSFDVVVMALSAL
jgi:hypothetical protein